MEDIEDYDDKIFELDQQIEKFIKFASGNARGVSRGVVNDGDKTNYLNQIKKNIGKMNEQLVYFKSEIYKIPRDKEQKYREKYKEYQEKITTYKYEAKKIELQLQHNEVGLMALEKGIDITKRVHNGLN